MIINSKKHFVIVLVGASGCGKTTISEYLHNKLHVPIHVSYTSRKKRDNEVDGKDYFFVDKKFFFENEFLEMVPIENNYYGTNKKAFEDILNKNFASVIVVDERGAKFLKDHYNDNIITVLLQMKKEDTKKLLIERDGKELGEKRSNYDESLSFDFPFYDFILPITGTNKDSWDYAREFLVNLISKK